jgi:hypothetical protein
MIDQGHAGACSGGESLIINSIKNMGKFACTTLYIGGPLVPAGTGVPPLGKPPLQPF